VNSATKAFATDGAATTRFRVCDSVRNGVRGPDRTTMRDGQDPFALVRCGKVQQRRDHAAAHLVVALAVLPALVVVEPAGELLGEALLDLGAREPLPGTDVHFSQCLYSHRLQPVRRRDDLRSLERAAQRARQHEGECPP